MRFITSVTSTAKWRRQLIVSDLALTELTMQHPGPSPCPREMTARSSLRLSGVARGMGEQIEDAVRSKQVAERDCLEVLREGDVSCVMRTATGTTLTADLISGSCSKPFTGNFCEEERVSSAHALKRRDSP